MLAGALLDKALFEQLFQNPSQALFGDAQNAQQLCDINAGIGAHEVQYPVMGAAIIGMRQNESSGSLVKSR